MEQNCGYKWKFCFGSTIHLPFSFSLTGLCFGPWISCAEPNHARAKTLSTILPPILTCTSSPQTFPGKEKGGRGRGEEIRGMQIRNARVANQERAAGVWGARSFSFESSSAHFPPRENSSPLVHRPLPGSGVCVCARAGCHHLSAVAAAAAAAARGRPSLLPRSLPPSLCLSAPRPASPPKQVAPSPSHTVLWASFSHSALFC